MRDWDDDDVPSKVISYATNNHGSQHKNANYATNNNMDDDWDDDSPPKNDCNQSQSGDNSSFEVQRQQVSMVIGRGGSTIREIEQKFNVKLNIEILDQMVMQLLKSMAIRVAEVKKYILFDLLERSYKRSRSNTREPQRDNNRSNFGRDRGNDNGERIEINHDKVGMVIGRGGSKIRELQDNFSVRINIDKTPNYSGKATITISGDGGNVQNAIREIKQLTDDGGYESKKPQPELMEEEPFQQIDWGAAARESEEANRRRWAALPPMQKMFYKENPDVTNMSAERVAEIRLANNNITVDRLILDETENAHRGPVPNPIEAFEQCFDEYPDLLDQIKKQGFEKPSPIQSQAWPILLKGEDMIGIAQTGTGKTLTFLLPAMIHTEYQSIPRSERKGPNVLVLAPTRELALQIEKEVAKYQFRGMKAVCVYDGGDRKAQIQNISTGVEIIIATPGRLNDLVEAKVIDVTTITYLLLDEADRMLDMGFEPQIRKVLLDIRPERQSVMTSATWPPGVRRLAQRYMNNPIQVCVGSLDLAAVHSVKQVIQIITEEDKFDEIKKFVLGMDPDEKAMIFVGKKARADDLSSEFSLVGIACQCMHGNRDQADREQALADIKNGAVKVLVATDVASRGIDIEDLTYVFNYDFPRNIEEYVHRVGRTGHAGKRGTSISFFTRGDWASAEELIKILEEADQEIPDELHEMKARFNSMKERREKERASFGGNSRGGGRGFGGGGGRSRY